MKRLILPIVLAVLIPNSANALPWWTWSQFAIGGGYRCRLMITNKSMFDWKGVAIVRHGNEQPWNWSWSVNGQDFTGQSEIQIALDPNETVSFSIDGDDVTRTGYLGIEPDSGEGSSPLSVTISYFYEFWSQDGKLLDSVGSPTSERSDDFIFPVERLENSDLLIDTGIAWCSIWNVPFDMAFILYDHKGNEVARKTIEFSGQEAKFLGQILDDLPSNIIGHVQIFSQHYLSVEVLRYVQNKADGTFQLTSTPADRN